MLVQGGTSFCCARATGYCFATSLLCKSSSYALSESYVSVLASATYSMLGTCLPTREYSGTMASTIGPRPRRSRTDCYVLGNCCPRTREYSGTMASTIGPRPWSRTDSTGHSAAEAANSRLYLPVEYDRVQGLSYRSNNPIPRTKKKKGVWLQKRRPHTLNPDSP
jgi:hypothetical protein